MNYISRGLTRIKRNRWQSLIIFLLCFIISLFLAFSLIMNHAISSTLIRAERKITPVVTATADLELLLKYSEMPQLENITQDIISKIGALPYVNYYETSLGISPLTKLDSYIPFARNIDVSGLENGNLLGDFNFLWMYGITNHRVVYVEEGLFNLVDGRLFYEYELDQYRFSNKATPILLPKRIAEINNLSIGNKITLYLEHFDIPYYACITQGGYFLSANEIRDHKFSSQVLKDYEFEIIGLLEIDFNVPYHDEAFHMQLVVYNTVFVPNWKVHQMILEERDSLERWRYVFNQTGTSLEERLSPTFFWILNNIDELPSFLYSAQYYLPNYFRFDFWDNPMIPFNSSINNLNWLSIQILYYSLGSMILILFLVISLILKERYEEFGLYLALGEKKIKIVAQILVEVLPILFLSILTALIFTRIISDNISTFLLTRELLNVGRWTTGSTFFSDWQEFSQLEFIGIGREKTLDELINIFEINISIGTVIIYFILGFISTTISILIACYSLLKLNLKEMLTKLF